jgi:N-methylhydantoinase A
VARPMGLSVTEAAWGIHRVVNENMAAAARIHGIERGRDLRAYPLFAFGGAGPVHAWAVGRILRVPRVLVPFAAGAMSAYGLLAAPLAFDFVRTSTQRVDRADWDRINRLYAEMEAEGALILERAGVAAADLRVRRSAEMRYLGQGHEVEVTVPSERLGPGSVSTITETFEAAYRQLYGRIPLGVAIEALNWRVVMSGPAPEVTIGPQNGDPGAGGDRAARLRDGLKKTRPAYFPEVAGYVDVPVYDRYRLTPGVVLGGPVIVEERESTAVFGPGARVRVDEALTLVAEGGS